MIYVSLVIFLVYMANVILGATSGNRFMGDVGECLTLMLSALFFVFDILRRDANYKASKKDAA